MKLKKGDCLVVKWLDVTQRNDWLSEEDAGRAPPAVCRSVGFFLNETKDVIRISDSVCSDTDRNVTVIPRGCVLKIRRWDRVRK